MENPNMTGETVLVEEKGQARVVDRPLHVAQGMPAPLLLVEYFCPDKNCPVVSTLDAYAGPPTCTGIKSVSAHPKQFMEPRSVPSVTQQFRRIGRVIDTQQGEAIILLGVEEQKDLPAPGDFIYVRGN